MIHAIRYAREQQGSLFRHLPGHADHGDRIRAQRLRPGRCQFHRVRSGTPDRVIYKLRELKGVDELGGTMRLGAYPCQLAEDSFARQAYGDARDQRAPPPPLRIQSRIRGRSDGSTGCGSPARRPTAPMSRSAKSRDHPWFLGLPVPSRVQIEAAGAASAVHRFHRRRQAASTGRCALDRSGGSVARSCRSRLQ